MIVFTVVGTSGKGSRVLFEYVSLESFKRQLSEYSYRQSNVLPFNINNKD